MVNKRGIFYWVEMVILLIVIVIIVLSFPRSQISFANVKANQDLQQLGFGAVKTLDEAGVLETLIDSKDFGSSNFKTLSSNMKKALPDSFDVEIEYFDGQSYFSEFGTKSAQSTVQTENKDTVIVEYTFAKRLEPVTIRLHLKRLFS